MKRSVRYRLVISAGWLLTPVVVWAASFIGGWLGAAIGRGSVPLLGGGVAAGTAALAGWILLLRWIERMGKQTRPREVKR